MKFLSPCGHAWNTVVIWAGAPSCYLELLDKLQKMDMQTVGPSLTVSFEPLAHRRNQLHIGISFSIGITLVNVHLNWLNWFHFLILEGGLIVILINCMIFLSPFLNCDRMLPFFPLTHDLNGFKSRINRQLLTAGSF